MSRLEATTCIRSNGNEFNDAGISLATTRVETVNVWHARRRKTPTGSRVMKIAGTREHRHQETAK
jgi:hypothetical protein